MSTKRYYSNADQVQPVLNFIPGKRVDASAIPPPLPTVLRTVNGANSALGSATGVVDPNFHRYRWDGSGSADVHYADGNGQAVVTHVSNTTFTFYALDAAPYPVPFVTSSVGSGALLGPSGSSPSNSYKVSISLTFASLVGVSTTVNVTVRNSSGTLVVTKNLVCAAGNTVYNFNNNLNSTVAPGTGYTVTVNSYTPSQAGTGFSYAIVTPGGYPTPADVTIHYNTAVGVTTDETVRVTHTGQIVKTFTNANDPILAYSGVFTVTAAQNPSGTGSSPAPFGGWTYDCPNPFVILWAGTAQDLSWNGSAPRYVGAQPAMVSIGYMQFGGIFLMETIKNAMNLGNALGIPAQPSAIPLAGITYLSGEYDKYFERFLNNPATVEQFKFAMLMGEQLLSNYVTTLINRDAAQIDNPPIPEIFQVWNEIASLVRWDLFGAPGKYFMPDESESTPVEHSPYWSGIATIIGDDAFPGLWVLELQTIK